MNSIGLFVVAFLSVLLGQEWWFRGGAWVLASCLLGIFSGLALLFAIMLIFPSEGS